MSLCIRMLALFWLLIVVTNSASASLVIHRLRTTYKVEKNGQVYVDEHITVRNDSVSQRQRITRDLISPSIHKQNKRTLNVQIVDAKFDGKPTPYQVEAQDTGQRIYIGNQNQPMPEGRHTYSLKYRLTDPIIFTEDDGEMFYWDVKDKSWHYPIEKITVKVISPSDFAGSFSTIDAYTGDGTRNRRHFRHFVGRERILYFTIKKELSADDRFIIAVGWPKGTFWLNSGTGIKSFIFNNYKKAILFGVLFATLYYCFTWFLFGRDKTIAVYSQEEPPEKFSPVALAYIRNLGAAGYAILIILTTLANKGFVSIKLKEEEYIITSEREDIDTLDKEEQELMRALKLSKKGSNYTITGIYQYDFGQAVKRITKILKKQYMKLYFTKNTGYFFFGVLIILASLSLFYLRDGITDLYVACISLAMSFAIANFTRKVTISSVMRLTLGGEKRVILGSNLQNSIASVFIGLAAAFMSFIVITLFFSAVTRYFDIFFPMNVLQIDPITGLLALKDIHQYGFIYSIAIYCALLIAVFKLALPQYSAAGHELVESSENFKSYLLNMEEEQFIYDQAKNERYLPYAISFDIQQSWIATWKKAFRKAGKKHMLSWYSHDDDHSQEDLLNMINMLSHRLYYTYTYRRKSSLSSR